MIKYFVGLHAKMIYYKVYIYTMRHKKHTRFFLQELGERSSNFNNFWYTYSRHNWPLNGLSVFFTSPNICFCTTWENRTDKIRIKIKNLIKLYLSRCVPTNSQSITRFDCCATAGLLNRFTIQEC